MSRLVNNPIKLPATVECSISGKVVTIKSSKGQLQHKLHDELSVVQENGYLRMVANGDSKSTRALAGMTRALLQNSVTGVDIGFERRLTVMGVGYRVQVQGKVLELALGFSQPVKFNIPEEVTIETPSQTEIVIKGIDKQKVGQIAADIRAYRPPEPYKGKGVRYADENIVRKEAKKT